MLVAASGCLGADTVSSDTGRLPRLGLRAFPLTSTIPQNGQKSVLVDLDRFAYTGSVSVAVDSVPPGITASVTPALLSPTQRSFSLDIKVAGEAARTAHRVVIKANAALLPTSRSSVIVVVP